MSAVVADTHAAVWYLFAPAKLTAAAAGALDRATAAGEPIYLAAVTLVELRYLVEKGKLPPATLDRLDAEVSTPGSAFALAPLDLAVVRAVEQIPRADVPDMPDRIIAATAHALGLPLVTRDRKIQSASLRIIW